MDKKKILRSEFNYNYDKEVDVLYISLGRPREAICVEKEVGLLFRIDPFKDKVVGITVIDAKKRVLSLTKHNVEKFAEKQLQKYGFISTSAECPQSPKRDP